MSDSGDVSANREPGADDEFDAFNDDTFGTGAAEWEESAHEELAKLTEEELGKLRQTQEFFEFGEEEEGELEELEKASENGHKLASELERNLQVSVSTQQPQGHSHQPSGPPDDPAILSVRAPLPPMTGMPPMPPQPHPGMFVLRPGLPPSLPSGQFLLHHQAPPPPHLQHSRFTVPPPMAQHFPQPPPPIRVPLPQNLISAQDLEREMLRSKPPPVQQQQLQIQQNWRHRQMQQHQQQYRHHQQQQHRGGHSRQPHNRSDDKNRETFGDDFVDSVMQEQRRQHQHHQQGYQQHQFGNRQPQRLITPGHVHTLGVLRSAREHQQRESTGNPQLDLELERRDQHEEGWQHDYYNRLAQEDDPYAGLMTPRERQWMVNIQMQQLKCENPFVDDYYFTVYNQKKEAAVAKEEQEKEEEEEEELDVGQRQLKRHEEGPQLLLHGQESGRDDQYRPVQFSNSLGKLQAITVKAPRKIIDVGVVNVDAMTEGASQKESRNYKSTLLEIERLYAILIEVEDCEKKLAALPTNTALHKQVEDERKRALARLHTSLVAENRLRRYLMVRKGKTLLRRCFRHLDDGVTQLLCATLFQLLPAAARKDREDKLLPLMWPGIKSHVRRCSFELLIYYMQLLNTGASTKSSSSYSTYRTVLCHPLGCTILLLLLRCLGMLYSSLGEESRAEIESAAANIWKAVREAADSIASPVERVALEFKKELGECPEQKRLVALAKS